MSGPGERPGTAYIGRVASLDYTGLQVTGRWHRKATKEDGQKEGPVGSVDLQTFFPWSSLDFVEILPESGERETNFSDLSRLGVQALKAKDYATALQYFREAIALKPGDQKIQYYIEEAERLSQGS